MRKDIIRHLILIAMLLLLSIATFRLLLPRAEASQPARPLGYFQGPMEPAIGTITANTVSTLTFPSGPKTHVVINNRSGKTLYIKANATVGITSTPTTTLGIDFVLDDGEDIFIAGWQMVKYLTVLVSHSQAITAGVGVFAVGQ